MLDLTNRGSPDFLAERLTPIVHERDVGRARYPVAHLDGVAAVTVYVSCSPDSEFTVRFLDNFSSGTCAARFESSATFPVPRGAVSSVLDIETSSTTEHFVVALPH